MLWLFLSVRVLSFVSFPFFFFFNDTATTEIYTLSLHDALPISLVPWLVKVRPPHALPERMAGMQITMRRPSVNCKTPRNPSRSEEHTSELQSRQYLVCRLLLEKKKTNNKEKSFSYICNLSHLVH